MFSRGSHCALSVVISFLIVSVVAEESASGCLIAEDSCTCSLQAAAGKCTRPTSDKMTSPGTCTQNDCTESYKCDCWGFEKCQISTCGQWEPTTAVPKDLAPDTSFSCAYKQGESSCRSVVGFMETDEGSENAKDAAVRYLEETGTEEVEILSTITEISTTRKTVIDALKTVDVEAVPEEDKEAMEADLSELMVQTASAAKDLCEATALSQEVFSAQVKARASRKASRAAFDAANDQEAKVLEKEKTGSCVDCASLKEEIKAIRKAQREAAMLAGTWAAKARTGQKKANEAKGRAKAKNLTAAEIRARCIKRKTKVLEELKKKAQEEAEKKAQEEAEKKAQEEAAKKAQEEAEKQKQPDYSSEFL